VDALDATDEVLLNFADTENPENFLRVDGTEVQRLAELDVLPVLDEEGCTLEHRVDHCLVAVVRREDDLAAPVGVFDRDAAGGLGDRSRTLGGTSLEELLHTGKTLRDVISGCRSTGVECTHRELGSRLTDRLGRDDADGLSDVDELS